MTSGRAVVLGDIGPWACAGMTGGRVYVRLNAFGIDREAIERRLGEGAKVELKDLDAEGLLDIDDLLGHYAERAARDRPGRGGRADARRSPPTPPSNFLMIVPAEGPGGPEHLDRVIYGLPQPTQLSLGLASLLGQQGDVDETRCGVVRRRRVR